MSISKIMDARLSALEISVKNVTTLAAYLDNMPRFPLGSNSAPTAAPTVSFMPTSFPSPAQTSPLGLVVGGDTAWMLVSTALVLFMTMPGLAIYYAGMVRQKNVLTCIMQILTICCLITFLWLVAGYSLSFAPVLADDQSNLIYGTAERLWLRGMKFDSTHQLATNLPETVFCAYQLTFAIITPALICGSFADRMKFFPMIVFITLWHFIVYCPIAHSLWHPKGFLFEAGSLDFAGGCVVHISSGVSGLVTVMVIGNRKGFGTKDFSPHNIALTYMGMSMLWVGWFGFNAGSAYAANARASFALLMTHIATSTSSLTWLITESIFIRRPSVLGMISGAVAGLVCITPAAGFVDATGAFFIGFFGGPLCYLSAQVKHHLGYDDALDAFGVHAIGGIVGGIATGFFATDTVGHAYKGVYYAGFHVGGYQLAMQLYAIAFTIGWTAFFTFLIAKGLDVLIGLRVSEAEEHIGLDSSIHGEMAFSGVAPNSNKSPRLVLEVQQMQGAAQQEDVRLRSIGKDDLGEKELFVVQRGSGANEDEIPSAALAQQQPRKGSGGRALPQVGMEVGHEYHSGSFHRQVRPVVEQDVEGGNTDEI